MTKGIIENVETEFRARFMNNHQNTNVYEYFKFIYEFYTINSYKSIS